jgi:hypothetical protein
MTDKKCFFTLCVALSQIAQTLEQQGKERDKAGLSPFVVLSRSVAFVACCLVANTTIRQCTTIGGVACEPLSIKALRPIRQRDNKKTKVQNSLRLQRGAYGPCKKSHTIILRDRATSCRPHGRT